MKILRTQLCQTAMILGLGLSVSACSMLAPQKPIAINTYMITASSTPVMSTKHAGAALMVAVPETDAAFNTTQMAYSIRPYQLAYYGQNRWAETPSQMLHPIIVQALQGSHYFRAIVTPPFAGRYDYILTTQISRLQMDFTQSPAVLQLFARAQLANVNTGQIIGTRQINISEVLAHDTPYDGVIAANKAAARLANELTQFALTIHSR